MMNLGNLNYLKEIVDSDDNLSAKMKSIVSDLADEKIIHISDSADFFVIFYEDVIQKELSIAFNEVLSEQDYNGASEHARVCLTLCSQFKNLPENIKVGAWLSDALKFIDYLILHYIQEIRKDAINPDDYAGEKSKYGEERRRYDKMKSYEKPISNAGSWMDDLYLIRNRIQHNTTVDKKSGKHTLKLLNYSQIRKSISEKYPTTLNLIEYIYK
ncbi:hypothetical protein [Winogradskyella vidalii]|uniref:hypothetical protein n=1 Tax=Winogradskyella vidalii TaxID=2615024 RepID=UPI0015CBC378|nr:hypothetical protein [Winogradskyella vidalii]